jgi:hypothetical protein
MKNISIPLTARSNANPNIITDSSQKLNDSAYLTQRETLKLNDNLINTNDETASQRS